MIVVADTGPIHYLVLIDAMGRSRLCRFLTQAKVLPFGSRSHFHLSADLVEPMRLHLA